MTLKICLKLFLTNMTTSATPVDDAGLRLHIIATLTFRKDPWSLINYGCFFCQTVGLLPPLRKHHALCWP